VATEQPRAVRRRDVLVGGGGVALGAVASWAGLRAADALSPFETATPQATYLGGLTEPWQGDHQAGILTAPQGFAGVTVGFGPGLFDKAGMAAEKPAWLAQLPAYPIDRLEPQWSEGDVVVQVC